VKASVVTFVKVFTAGALVIAEQLYHVRSNDVTPVNVFTVGALVIAEQ
jgi:hypothetical protein